MNDSIGNRGATSGISRRRVLGLALAGTLLAALFRFPAWMRVGGLEVGRLLVLGVGLAGWVALWRTHQRLRVKGL